MLLIRVNNNCLRLGFTFVRLCSSLIGLIYLAADPGHTVIRLNIINGGGPFPAHQIYTPVPGICLFSIRSENEDCSGRVQGRNCTSPKVCHGLLLRFKPFSSSAASPSPEVIRFYSCWKLGHRVTVLQNVLENAGREILRRFMSVFLWHRGKRPFLDNSQGMIHGFRCSLLRLDCWPLVELCTLHNAFLVVINLVIFGSYYESLTEPNTWAILRQSWD